MSENVTITSHDQVRNRISANNESRVSGEEIYCLRKVLVESP